MKIVEMLGRRRVAVVDAPEPQPRGDLVVVKVLASAICGTEARSYQVDGAAEAGRFNSGHEAAGVIWKTAPGARLEEGARVAIHPDLGNMCGRCANCYRGVWLRCLNPCDTFAGWQGAHAQYLLRPERNCLPLPDDVSFELGAMLVDCVGTPYRGIRRLGVDAFDTVLITGLGPLGAAASIICRALGARVIATEVAAYRLARAAEYGVDHARNPQGAQGAHRGRRVDFQAVESPGIRHFDGIDEARIHTYRDLLRPYLADYRLG